MIGMGLHLVTIVKHSRLMAKAACEHSVITRMKVGDVAMSP
jgi:hypothetical protein